MKNSEGPTGTNGCACRSRDPKQCASIRYGMDHPGEECECICHQWDDDEEDDEPPIVNCLWVCHGCGKAILSSGLCDACDDRASDSFSIVRAMEKI